MSKAAILRARSGWRYRGNVALRTLAGTVGAYAVAALAAMLLFLAPGKETIRKDAILSIGFGLATALLMVCSLPSR